MESLPGSSKSSAVASVGSQDAGPGGESSSSVSINLSELSGLAVLTLALGSSDLLVLREGLSELLSGLLNSGGGDGDGTDDQK